jgi:hypothetical protein
VNRRGSVKDISFFVRRSGTKLIYHIIAAGKTKDSDDKSDGNNGSEGAGELFWAPVLNLGDNFGLLIRTRP